MDYLELYNKVFNLSIGWTNWYWANETLIYLTNVKNDALNHKGVQPCEFQLDIKDVFNQVEEFKNCLRKQTPTTELEEERFTLAAYEYALNNKPIITIDYHAKLTQEEADNFLARYKHDVFLSLINFYIYNQKSYPALYLELKDKFIKFLAFCKSLKKAVPTANYVNPTPLAILVIKKAIKEKDDAFAKEVLNSYEYEPSNDKEIEYLSKIRGKLLDKQLLN